jgi:hypothetical protein
MRHISCNHCGLPVNLGLLKPHASPPEIVAQ